MASITRTFLARVLQDDVPLPVGPLLCHPGSLSEVLLMELWHKDPNVFKARVLQDQLASAFAAAGRDSSEPLFFAGFGNKETDREAYIAAGVRPEDVYIIDKGSRIARGGASTDSKGRTERSGGDVSPTWEERGHGHIEMNPLRRDGRGSAASMTTGAGPVSRPYRSYGDLELLPTVLAGKCTI